MAPGAGLLNCDGYIAIIDAVKILAPRTIQSALQRLAEQHPHAHLIIAAGRQGEPDALSSDEIRAVLGLHPDLPVYPYVPSEPKTVHRLIRRLARTISDSTCVPPPIFAGEQPSPPQADSSAPAPDAAGRRDTPQVPRIHGLAHVAITVSDLSRALDFYRGLLGFRLLGHLDWPDDPDGLTITLLDTGRGSLELFSYANVPVKPAPPADDLRVGLQHLALHVTDLDTIADHLMCAGVPFTIEPKNIPGGVRIAFFTDPDGTSIELIEGDLVFTRR
jgi:catechol 2,3-dioxygenase-like lactoylglutathione lyase family enzyme